MYAKRFFTTKCILKSSGVIHIFFFTDLCIYDHWLLRKTIWLSVKFKHFSPEGKEGGGLHILAIENTISQFFPGTFHCSVGEMFIRGHSSKSTIIRPRAFTSVLRSILHALPSVEVVKKIRLYML